MPQMMPMKWLLIYSISISMIFMFIMIIYYQATNFTPSNKGVLHYKSWNWKW